MSAHGHFEDRVRLRAKGDAIRAERARDRQRDDRDFQARVAAAQASGEPAVFTRRHDDGHIEAEGREGQAVRLFPGEVVFVNPPGRRFDYRVTVVVRGGLAVGPDGSVRVGDDPYLDVGEVAILPRAGGDRFSVRAVQTDGVGELTRRAVNCLTETPDGTGIARESAVEMMRKPRAPRSELLGWVAAAYRKAEKVGAGRHAAVEAALAGRGEKHSPGQVKALIGECQEKGLLPKRGPGRPKAGRG